MGKCEPPDINLLPVFLADCFLWHTL